LDIASGYGFKKHGLPHVAMASMLARAARASFERREVVIIVRAFAIRRGRSLQPATLAADLIPAMGMGTAAITIAEHACRKPARSR
jgi:hypothetical protein